MRFEVAEPNRFRSKPRPSKLALAWTSKIDHKAPLTHFHGHSKAQGIYYLRIYEISSNQSDYFLGNASILLIAPTVLNIFLSRGVLFDNLEPFVFLCWDYQDLKSCFYVTIRILKNFSKILNFFLFKNVRKCSKWRL